MPSSPKSYSRRFVVQRRVEKTTADAGPHLTSASVCYRAVPEHAKHKDAALNLQPANIGTGRSFAHRARARLPALIISEAIARSGFRLATQNRLKNKFARRASCNAGIQPLSRIFVMPA